MGDLRASLFGKLVLQTGLVSEAQLAECLTFQEECREAGKRVPRLGEVMAIKKFLTVEQVKAILRKQTTAEEVSPVGASGAKPRDVDWTKPGSIFSGYEIIDTISEDATGVTVKAKHGETDTMVAIRILSGKACEDASYVARFEEHARKASQLKHSNILRVLAANKFQDHYYYVSEYSEGVTLDKMLENHGKLDPLFVIEMGIQVASALEYGHARGFFHQDIKASHILVLKDKTVKLAGYGSIPDPILDLKQLVKSSGDVPFYVAPEQAAGKAACADARTDIYSLGAVLFHAAAGQPPFHGASLEEVLLRIAEEEPVMLGTLNSHVPRPLETAVAKMLTVNPDERYQSATKLIAALEEARTASNASPAPGETRAGTSSRRIFPGALPGQPQSSSSSTGVNQVIAGFQHGACYPAPRKAVSARLKSKGKGESKTVPIIVGVLSVLAVAGIGISVFNQFDEEKQAIQAENDKLRQKTEEVEAKLKASKIQAAAKEASSGKAGKKAANGKVAAAAAPAAATPPPLVPPPPLPGTAAQAPAPAAPVQEQVQTQVAETVSASPSASLIQEASAKQTAETEKKDSGMKIPGGLDEDPYPKSE